MPGLMDQGPLGAIVAALIRLLPRSSGGRREPKLNSVLNVLAMAVGLLVLGWLLGSDDKQGKHEGSPEELPLERLHAQSGGSVEER